MKKVIIALAAVLGLAFVVPATVQSAQAETVVIKRGHDRGHHYGWRHHDRGHHYGWRHRDHRANKVVIIKKQRHSHM